MKITIAQLIIGLLILTHQPLDSIVSVPTYDWSLATSNQQMAIDATAPASSLPAAKSDLLWQSTAKYLKTTISQPKFGSLGGEWTVIGLSRSEISDATYYETYFQNIVRHLQAQKGMLSTKKYTEYARLIIALSAINKNPANVGGYNLLTPLTDYTKVTAQGINGPIWALIALDSGNYLNPEIRLKYIDYLLQHQNKDGGWSLSGATSEPDITAMSLQALSPYAKKPIIQPAIDQALAFLSNAQTDTGGYRIFGAETSEATAQTIIALCSLDLPLTDKRFVKNGISLIDHLQTFYLPEQGFKHSLTTTNPNLMATEQAYLALTALHRQQQHQNHLYTIHYFPDVVGHIHADKINALAADGILSGDGTGHYRPNQFITRAEFTAVLVKALGLKLTSTKNHPFVDINSDNWYASYVNAAYQHQLIKGTSTTTFCPDQNLLTKHAATILIRVAQQQSFDVDYINRLSSYQQIEAKIRRHQVAALIYDLLERS